MNVYIYTFIIIFFFLLVRVNTYKNVLGHSNTLKIIIIRTVIGSLAAILPTHTQYYTHARRI